jgi:flagellar hook-associated protein 1 FlgK
MAELFSVGISALNANSRLLTTTGHNISNANTEGYSRQRVTLESRQPQYLGSGFSGKGVDIAGIARISDEFLTQNLRLSASSEARSAAFANLAGQVDTLLSEGSFSPAMEKYFTAVQDVNNDPSSIPARQVLLGAAGNLTNRFQDLDARLSQMGRDLNKDLAAKLNSLNSLSSAVASLNKDIVRATGIGQGAAPNDLLDKRDALLKQMSQIVNITANVQDDGSVNVFAGSGQLLVNGPNTVKLDFAANALDSSRTEIVINTGGATVQITESLTGGELGGLLEFRDQVLDPARNAVGRLATVVADTYNSQHRAGLDLQGALGGALFNRGQASVSAAAGNTGTLSVALDSASLANLTTSDYALSHNGTDFILERLDTGATQTLSGAGPFSVDGMTLTVGAAPAAGDRYLIQPTKYVARGMTVAVTDPQRLAFANPVKSAATLANTGNAKISAPTVLDSANAALQTSTQIVFNNPPTTYQINGAGPLIPFTSGGNIDVNGWRVQITGAPVAGDSFTVQANTNGRGDNANGLLMFGLRSSEILDGNTATYQDAFGQLLGKVATQTQQAQISRDALRVQLDNAEAARDSVAGVNLDEEAANLVRYQQSYQGAAQVIASADQMFQALINAMRG